MARATVLKRFELSPEAAGTLEAYARETGQSQTAVIEAACYLLARVERSNDEPRTPASPDVQTESKAGQIARKLGETIGPAAKPKRVKGESVLPREVQRKDERRIEAAESVDGMVGPRGFRTRAESVGDAVANCHHLARYRVGSKCTACGVSL